MSVEFSKLIHNLQSVSNPGTAHPIKHSQVQGHSYVVIGPKDSRQGNFKDITRLVKTALERPDLTPAQRKILIDGYKEIKVNFTTKYENLNWFAKLFSSGKHQIAEAEALINKHSPPASPVSHQQVAPSPSPVNHKPLPPSPAPVNHQPTPAMKPVPPAPFPSPAPVNHQPTPAMKPVPPAPFPSPAPFNHQPTPAMKPVPPAPFPSPAPVNHQPTPAMTPVSTNPPVPNSTSAKTPFSELDKLKEQGLALIKSNNAKISELNNKISQFESEVKNHQENIATLKEDAKYQEFETKRFAEMRLMHQQNPGKYELIAQINEKWDKLLPQEFPLIVAEENKIAAINKQVASLNNQIKKLEQSSTEAYAPIAKKLAMTVETSGYVPPGDPSAEIQHIRSGLENKSNEDLQKYVLQHQNTLNELVKESKSAGEIWRVGRDAKNIAFLTCSDNPLKNEGVILAIFAAEILAKRNVQGAKQLIEVEPNFSLATMLEWGLKRDPMELESMPINFKKNGSVDEYIRRKDVKNTFIPVLESLHRASQTILGTPESTPLKPSETKTEAYSINNWPAYRDNFEAIISELGNKSPAEKNAIVKNAANFGLGALQEQAVEGLAELVKLSDFKSEARDGTLKVEASMDDIVNFFCSSPGILNSSVSHGFDRLHLIAGLMDNNKAITTSDGTWSTKEFLQKVFAKLAENPTEENALAAEQLYVRLKMINKTPGIETKENKINTTDQTGEKIAGLRQGNSREVPVDGKNYYLNNTGRSITIQLSVDYSNSVRNGLFVNLESNPPKLFFDGKQIDNLDQVNEQYKRVLNAFIQ